VPGGGGRWVGGWVGGGRCAYRCVGRLSNPHWPSSRAMVSNAIWPWTQNNGLTDTGGPLEGRDVDQPTALEGEMYKISAVHRPTPYVDEFKSSNNIHTYHRVCMFVATIISPPPSVFVGAVISHIHQHGRGWFGRQVHILPPFGIHAGSYAPVVGS
jgi:hypothetical protein